MSEQEQGKSFIFLSLSSNTLSAFFGNSIKTADSFRPVGRQCV